MLTNPRRDAAEHLSVEDLSALLSGALPEETESSLAVHLEQCATCREALETAAGRASWWHEAESFLAEDQASVDAAVDPVAELRGWLGPTDDPDSMGRIGRFEVLGVAGRGATGVVFKAFESTLGRYVALKVLSPVLSGSEAARKRFAREARAAAAVNHEHVAPIYGVDEFRGLPYLTMQYVSGPTLAERLAKNGPLATAESVRIALQTARALAAAHEQGVIHRDVKPGNILLESGLERAIVTDFGLARAVDDAAMTRTGAIAGTPQYMSPEQARGEPADARSDLFSLGAVLYSMCTGRPPFESESLVGLLRRVCDDRPRPVRELNPEAPRWLEAIIDKLLAKRPEDRFPSAHAAAAALAAELAYLQDPIGSRRPSRTWRRKWKARTAVIAGVILTSLVVALAVWPDRSSDRPGANDAPPAAVGEQVVDAPAADAESGVGEPLPSETDSAAESDQAAEWEQVEAAWGDGLQQAATEIERMERIHRLPSGRSASRWREETASVSEAIESLRRELAEELPPEPNPRD